jgi:hypothetical protein
MFLYKLRVCCQGVRTTCLDRCCSFCLWCGILLAAVYNTFRTHTRGVIGVLGHWMSLLSFCVIRVLLYHLMCTGQYDAVLTTVHLLLLCRNVVVSGVDVYEACSCVPCV